MIKLISSVYTFMKSTFSSDSALKWAENFRFPNEVRFRDLEVLRKMDFQFTELVTEYQGRKA